MRVGLISFCLIQPSIFPRNAVEQSKTNKQKYERYGRVMAPGETNPDFLVLAECRAELAASF
jgi:hypothetical protein